MSLTEYLKKRVFPKAGLPIAKILSYVVISDCMLGYFKQLNLCLPSAQWVIKYPEQVFEFLMCDNSVGASIFRGEDPSTDRFRN